VYEFIKVLLGDKGYSQAIMTQPQRRRSALARYCCDAKECDAKLGREKGKYQLKSTNQAAWHDVKKHGLSLEVVMNKDYAPQEIPEDIKDKDVLLHAGQTHGPDKAPLDSIELKHALVCVACFEKAFMPTVRDVAALSLAPKDVKGPDFGVYLTTYSMLDQ